MEDLFKITGEVTLKKGGGRELKAGGMWIYDNEMELLTEDLLSFTTLMAILWE